LFLVVGLFLTELWLGLKFPNLFPGFLAPLMIQIPLGVVVTPLKLIHCRQNMFTIHIPWHGKRCINSAPVVTEWKYGVLWRYLAAFCLNRQYYWRGVDMSCFPASFFRPMKKHAHVAHYVFLPKHVTFKILDDGRIMYCSSLYNTILPDLKLTATGLKMVFVKMVGEERLFKFDYDFSAINDDRDLTNHILLKPEHIAYIQRNTLVSLVNFQRHFSLTMVHHLLNSLAIKYDELSNVDMLELRMEVFAVIKPFLGEQNLDIPCCLNIPGFGRKAFGFGTNVDEGHGRCGGCGKFAPKRFKWPNRYCPACWSRIESPVTKELDPVIIPLMGDGFQEMQISQLPASRPLSLKTRITRPYEHLQSGEYSRRNWCLQTGTPFIRLPRQPKVGRTSIGAVHGFVFPLRRPGVFSNDSENAYNAVKYRVMASPGFSPEEKLWKKVLPWMRRSHHWTYENFRLKFCFCRSSDMLSLGFTEEEVSRVQSLQGISGPLIDDSGSLESWLVTGNYTSERQRELVRAALKLEDTIMLPHVFKSFIKTEKGFMAAARDSPDTPSLPRLIQAPRIGCMS